MKLKPVSLAVAAVAAGLTLSSAHAGVVKTEGEDIIVSTKNGGLQLKTEDGAFSFKVSGKLQWDYANLDKFIAGGKDKDFGYLRRGKLGISGKAYSDWKYKLVLESDDNDIVLDEANITYGGFKPANIKIGRWGNEFGLEDSVSSSWIMAIERPHIYEALRADGNNDYGIQVFAADKNYLLRAGMEYIGLDKSTDSEEKQQFAYQMRAAYAPIMEDEMLLHVGFSYYNANPDKETDAAKSSIKFAKKGTKIKLFNGTGMNVKDDAEYAFELAGQFQSLQLQGEYFIRDIKSDNANSDVKVTGYYGQVSYMLDGGKRTYKKGEFSKPKGGKWEAFARYTTTTTDADSAVTLGTNGDDVETASYTLGVNYYPTKNIRGMLNYVHGEVKNHSSYVNEKDDGNAIVARVQYVF
ncbi:OprO/OprP family phosphate-selective porin [Endozoicomonas arenosclerae]|uniref:OprO/OprP family phosphate-selective porin n=1 Tax=Endozoicomonas arenosclerae TaxID=1633495 RepID=UPI000782A38A|nr:porin [Endozoicomonas arenosclerae]